MAQNKGTALQDPFLNALRKERIPVSIYLVNGIKLQGLRPNGRIVNGKGFNGATLQTIATNPFAGLDRTPLGQ